MAETSFNEAERYLFANWLQARELEDSIQETLASYQSLCELLAERVRGDRTGFEVITEVIKTSGPSFYKEGFLVIGKPSWPRDGKWWSGFWLTGIRLDYLSDAEKEPPCPHFWLCDTGEMGDNFAAATTQILTEAGRVLTPEEWKQCKASTDDGGWCIEMCMPPKQKLVELLTCGNNDGFVDALAEPLETLVKLLPAIDGALEQFGSKGDARKTPSSNPA